MFVLCESEQSKGEGLAQKLALASCMNKKGCQEKGREGDCKLGR